MPSELPTSAKLDEMHALYEEHPLMHKAVGMVRLAQHRATLEEVRGKYVAFASGQPDAEDFWLWLTAQREADDGEA